MKKVITFVIFECLLLLSCGVQLRAMEPATDFQAQHKMIRFERAKDRLDELLKEFEELRTNPTTAAIKQAEYDVQQARSEVERVKTGPRMVVTLQDITSADMAWENLERAQLRLVEIQNRGIPDVSVELEELDGRIKTQAAEVIRLAEKAGQEVDKKVVILAGKQPKGIMAGIERLREKTFPSKKLIGIGAGAAAAIAAAGALYAGLKWYKKRRIIKAISKHGLTLEMFSSSQKDAMAAAVLASSRLPGSMRYLRSTIKKRQLASDAVPVEMMWDILAQLYYRKTPTAQEIQNLKERVVPQGKLLL